MDKDLERIKSDFRIFLWLVWKHLNLPVPNTLQIDIADFLQHGPNRRMVQAPRNSGKSWITVAYVLWRLLKNPNERIVVVSGTEKHAIKFNNFVKQLISEMDILKHLMPDKARGQRDSVMAFDTGPSDPHIQPSVTSLGITSQLTGNRATILLSDDVETTGNSESQLQRDKLLEKIKEYAALLVNEVDCEIIYLGTPQSGESIYKELPDRGYTVRTWTARYLSVEQLSDYEGRLAPWLEKAAHEQPELAGQPTEPFRLGEEALMKKRLEYGPAGFQLQYMLNTNLSDLDKFPLKLGDCICMDLDKEVAPYKVTWAGTKEYEISDVPAVGLSGDRWHKPMWFATDVGSMVPYQGSVMFIDPSGRGKDETGYAIVNQLNSMLFLLDCGGFVDGYGVSTLEALAMKAKEYKVNAVILENNFGDGLYQKLFEPVLHRIYPVSIDEKFIQERRAKGQKEMRIIDTLEPILANHRLVVDRKLIEKDAKNYNSHPIESQFKYQLFYQLTRITRDKGSLVHDDRLDALAGAVSYWIEAMARDQETLEKEHNDALFDEQLRQFVESITGNRGSHGGFGVQMGFEEYFETEY